MGKYFYIYKIHFLRGFPAGRYYIGKRVYQGKDISNDKYVGSGNFCISYFKKYGAIEGDTYIKEILEINPSKEINDNREAIWIGDLWETDELCMNQKPGGDGGGASGIKRSPETCSNISKALKQWHLNNPGARNGRVHSDETKKKLSIMMLGNKHGIGHKLSKEAKLAIKESSQLPIYQYDMDGNFIKKWECKSDAVRYYNNKHIISASTGKRKSAAGYLWSSKKYDVLPQYRSASKKQIKATIDGEELIFNSIKDAALYVIRFNHNYTLRGISESISKCCRGLQKTALKIKWEYA